MIKNKTQCAYCGRAIIKAKNEEYSRSVEHMVPNAMLSVRRSKSEGDFYTCKKCNELKSKIDEILSRLARVQSPNTELAEAEAKKMEQLREKGLGPRYEYMIQRAKPSADSSGSMLLPIPISGREMVNYIQYLGKGQYLIENGRIFDSNKSVMVVGFANKQVLQIVENNYKYGSSPFRDLEQNPKTSFSYPKECSVHSGNGKYVFIFHDSIAITIQILPKSRKNYRKSRESERDIVCSLGYKKHNRKRPRSK